MYTSNSTKWTIAILLAFTGLVALCNIALMVIAQ